MAEQKSNNNRWSWDVPGFQPRKSPEHEEYQRPPPLARLYSISAAAVSTGAPYSELSKHAINSKLLKLKDKLKELSLVPPLFDRLIPMVIDGLPAEFVLGKDGEPPVKSFKEAMPYTQSLLSKGRAIGYHAKAAPPTVTMPRLKVKDTVQVDRNVSRHLVDELSRTDWNLLEELLNFGNTVRQGS